MTVDRQRLAAWLETQLGPITGASYEAVTRAARDAFDPTASLMEFESTLRALGSPIVHRYGYGGVPGSVFVLELPEMPR